MSKKIFGSVENGLNRKQFDSIVDYVEKMIFDGCGGRKMRTMYLIETGKMFKKGNVKTVKMRSYYISTKYRGISPISNMDRIIHNILNVVSGNNKYPVWMQDENTLRIALNATAGIV
jgi:hypothetical protein